MRRRCNGHREFAVSICRFFFFQAEDGIRDLTVTGVQTCALPISLVPTFIMIGVWGRGERKNYATFQITLYLSIGALIALVGLIALYLQLGAGTFDIPKLKEHIRDHPLSAHAQRFIFPLLLFGFGILVSLWPF